jgi:transcriptional regulator with XRE-family HTH domain
MSNQGKRPDEVEFNTVVGKNIRYLRKLKKLTQSKLADAIGVATQQVSKYELGSNGLHSYSLYKVAHRVFNISMDVLADPQMIIKHEGFKDKHESQEYQTLGTATPQDAGYLKPQKGIGSMEEITKDQMDAALSKAKAEGYLEPKVCVGSLEEIKDQLKKDGIDPEETILPTLRKIKKRTHGYN